MYRTVVSCYLKSISKKKSSRNRGTRFSDRTAISDTISEARTPTVEVSYLGSWIRMKKLGSSFLPTSGENSWSIFGRGIFLHTEGSTYGTRAEDLRPASDRKPPHFRLGLYPPPFHFPVHWKKTLSESIWNLSVQRGTKPDVEGVGIFRLAWRLDLPLNSPQMNVSDFLKCIRRMTTMLVNHSLATLFKKPDFRWKTVRSVLPVGLFCNFC